MDDNKAFVIVIVTTLLTIGIFEVYNNKVVDSAKSIYLEQEKTKQLMIQYKIDSLNSTKKDNIK